MRICPFSLFYLLTHTLHFSIEISFFVLFPNKFLEGPSLHLPSFIFYHRILSELIFFSFFYSLFSYLFSSHICFFSIFPFFSPLFSSLYTLLSWRFEETERQVEVAAGSQSVVFPCRAGVYVYDSMYLSLSLSFTLSLSIYLSLSLSLFYSLSLSLSLSVCFSVSLSISLFFI